MEPKPKPKFFSVIGYTWLVMGLLGLLGGLLSLPALFQMDQIRAQIQQAFAGQGVPMMGMLDEMLRWAAPMTWTQLIISAWTSWAAWKFLEGKDIGRLSLSGVNGLTAAGAILSLILVHRMLFRFYDSMNVALMVRAGVTPDIPLMTNVFLGVSGVLLVLPLAWMGWYFHSRPVKEFFRKS